VITKFVQGDSIDILIDTEVTLGGTAGVLDFSAIALGGTATTCIRDIVFAQSTDFADH
jgi:hypothetical protein